MKYVLAPLAGFTDAPFRRLCTEGGADLTYTEMVSAAGLAHGSSPPRHLMVFMTVRESAEKRFLFVINELSSTVSSFSFLVEKSERSNSRTDEQSSRSTSMPAVR